MFACFKNLKTRLRIKLSLLKERRRRKNGSLYPRVIPQHLSQIDLGEELTRVPSLISLQEANTTAQALTRVPSLSSLQSNSSSRTEQPNSISATEVPSTENMHMPEAEEVLCDQEYQWPVETNSNVQLAQVKLSLGTKLSGSVMVKNLAYQKNVFIRWTINNWASHQDLVASYDHSSEGLTHDWFTFSTESMLSQHACGVCIELAVCYQVNGLEFWDNHQGSNFALLMH